jgi:uncharacterized 2Fe-2S/4Fe-4S cluster protein (DUF4445 family)
MRAAAGAIASVRTTQHGLECGVLGGGSARGICGSGLVDAVAAGLDIGTILSSGRMPDHPWRLSDAVALTQSDIRELQLAKGAIAAGLRLLLLEFQASPDRIDSLHLAGAFGNSINRASAARIGLIPADDERVIPAGNTALLGAKLALCSGAGADLAFSHITRLVRHLALHESPQFQESYVEQMQFPPNRERV